MNFDALKLRGVLFKNKFYDKCHNFELYGELFRQKWKDDMAPRFPM